MYIMRPFKKAGHYKILSTLDMYINLDRITFECRTDLVCNTTQGLGNQDQEVYITDKTGAGQLRRICA